MTAVEGPGDPGRQDIAEDAPGWGLPSPGPEAPAVPGDVAPDDDAPLTAVQQAVVNEVAEGQRALGHEMQWRRRSTLNLFDGAGGVTASVIDSALASEDAKRVTESEREAQFIAGTLDSVPDPEPHFPAGGPPTPEEVHEAEMNPWPHHGMAETIERNRQLRQQGGDSGSQGSTPDN